MGRSWVGFQPSVKPLRGERVTVTDQCAVTLDAPALVALLSTQAGLAAWLADSTEFSARRGGDIEFVDAEGTFGGSYAVLDIPRRVVIVTERHGEIDVALTLRNEAISLSITVTRIATPSESPEALRERATALIARLREECGHGR